MIAKQVEDYFTREQIIKDFFACVERIKDEDLNSMANEMLKDAPDGFWESKGSSSGRNHPPENNLEGVGLLVHIIKAMQIAEDSFRFFGIRTEFEEDMVRVAIILHDLFKYGEDWEEFDRAHGLVCAEKLEDYDTIDPYVLHKIQEWIETHMSRWTSPLESMKHFIFQDRAQLIVALSDYYSSRNQISFYPGLSILGGKNEQRQET